MLWLGIITSSHGTVMSFICCVMVSCVAVYLCLRVVIWHVADAAPAAEEDLEHWPLHGPEPELLCVELDALYHHHADTPLHRLQEHGAEGGETGSRVAASSGARGAALRCRT